MIGLKFDIDDRGVKAKLAKLEAAAENLEPAFRVVGSVLLRRIDLCFKLGIDPWGTPWAKLRMRKGQPLRDKGLLQRSFSAKVDPTGVTVGTNLKYAPTHQFGARMGEYGRYYQLFRLKYGEKDFRRYAGSKKGHPIPWGDVPARPFLPLRKGAKVLDLPPTWSVSVVQALRAHFKKEIA